jgi:hypothetical protein
MLRWTSIGCLGGMLAAACLGCNDRVVPPGDLPAAAAKPADEGPLPPLAKRSLVPEAREYATPKDAVDGFLAALRAGDQVQVKHMLTAKAKAEAAAKGVQIRPPGSATATYVVGEVKELTDENGLPGAHVHCRWTDQDPDGTKFSFDVAWLLRSESGHWRIMGLAAELPGTREPVLMSFENQDQLQAARQSAEARLAEQPQPAEMR